MKTNILVLLAIIGMALVPFAIWTVKSKFEASAYNRATGASVSTWDAMWIELRVTGGAR